MGLMAKMRNLAPAFILSVGLIFILFMVISDSNVVEALGGRSNLVGSVNGRDITYQEYERYVQQIIENQKAQTGQEPDPDLYDQYRDQAWDQLVSTILTEQQLEKMGIKVTDEEVVNEITGPNPPEFLRRNFIDSLGNFNRDMYLEAIFDPQNKNVLVQAEEIVKQQLLSQKLQSILLASVNVSEDEIKTKFIDNNVKMTAEYVVVDVNSFADSLVTVTDGDMKDYYNKNLDKYKQEAQRKIEYVIFNLAPSKADSNAVLNTLNAVKEKLTGDTSSFKTYVDIYSEQPYALDSIDINNMPPELSKVSGTLKKGELVGPFISGEFAYLYKIVDVTKSPNTFVRSSHILISGTGTDSSDLAEANRIFALAEAGESFAALAEKYSKDVVSAKQGGDLGWYGKGAMVKEFEDASFNGPVGKVQKPVKTSYGYHIILVTERSNNRLVVEKIVNSLKPSGVTIDRTMQIASDFAFLADKNGFTQSAKEMNYTVQQSAPFNKEVFSIPGLGYNRSMVVFSFENGLNTISPAFKLPSGYVVFRISEIVNAGVKKFELVKEEIKNEVIRLKKFDLAKEVIENVKKAGGELSNASNVDSKARYGKSEGFSTSGNIPTVGVDYAFGYAAYNSKENTILGPVKGMRGYYLIKVLDKTPFDEANYNAQRSMILSQLVQERRNNFVAQWLTKLKEDANITDNRYKFYR